MDILNQEIPLWVSLVYLVYMAAVQALPRPDQTAGKGYTFLFGFAHALAWNFSLAYNPKSSKGIAPEAETEKTDTQLPPQEPDLLQKRPWKYPPMP